MVNKRSFTEVYKYKEKSFTYKPGDAAELKNRQADANNFVSKFMDDNGMIKDAKGYHRSLAIAMNPDKFAQFFYDQGVANAVDDVTKKSKRTVFSNPWITPGIIASVKTKTTIISNGTKQLPKRTN